MILMILSSQLLPMTTEIGFIQSPVDAFTQWFIEYHRADPSVQLEVRRLKSESLSEAIRALLPLTSGGIRRYLFLPADGWTAYLNNAHSGTDVGLDVSRAALGLSCQSIRVVCVPDTIRVQDGMSKGMYGATVLELYGPEPTDFLNYRRTISAVNDGGTWRFDESGEPLPFEAVDAYRRRRVRDRFTPEMLRIYLGALGLRPFDEDFYQVGGALLLCRAGPGDHLLRDYTLEEVQANL